MIVSGAPLVKEDSVNDLVQFSLLINHVVKQVVLHPKTKQPAHRHAHRRRGGWRDGLFDAPLHF